MRVVVLAAIMLTFILPEHALAAWYMNTGNQAEVWPYRQKITISGASVEATLANFPVLVEIKNISNPLFSKARSNGWDILFTGSDGVTKLNHEIEYYNGATGSLDAWVMVPTLVSTSDSFMYMYYGCSDAPSQENKNGTWDSNFTAVYHLNGTAALVGTTGEVVDSTSNNNGGRGMPAGTKPSVEATGKINGAFYFPSGDVAGGAYIDLGNKASLQATNEVVVEAWAKPADTTSYLGIAGKISINALAGYAIWRFNTGSVFRGCFGNGTLITVDDTVSSGTSWHYVVGVRRGGTDYLYVDGVSVGTPNARAISDSGLPANIGRKYADFDDKYFKGTIDEVRFSNVGRSASWIKTCYRSQGFPDSFIRLSDEEHRPGAVMFD